MTDTSWHVLVPDPAAGSGSFLGAAAQHLLQLYLRRHGWEPDAPGPAGALWRNDRDAVIAVPTDVSAGSPEWRGVLDRVANFEQRPTQDVAVSVELQLTDVTRLRAANDIVIRGSIPLGAGVTLVSSAWTMLRASATTSVRPRPHIAGGFSKRADELAATARLGHTQEGSYIIPVLMPLTEPGDDRADEPAMPGLEVTRVAHEPAERRVMRTFAEALEAVNRVIVQPEQEPRAGQLEAAVVAGVSRELVTAVHRVISDEAVAQFEASFSWADGVGSPAGAPSTVSIPAAAAARLNGAAQLLKTSSYSAEEVITGPIVEVRHEPNDPFGQISVQTMRRGRPVEVRVRLGAQQLTEAFNWARDGRTVLCEGVIRRSPGQPLMVDAPRQVHPLNETYLSPSGW